MGFLVTDQFEDLAVKVPFTALSQANVDVVMVSDRANAQCSGLRGQLTLQSDVTATDIRASDLDAVIIPGGRSPEQLRRNEDAVSLVRDALHDGTVVAAIGKGSQLLTETDQLAGRQTTGHPSIRKQVQNAGGVYVDRPIVVEDNLITARRLSDMPMLTVMLCNCLNIPDSSSRNVSKPKNMWWQIAEDWGGSSHEVIVAALNMALLGEQYTINCFQTYAEQVKDDSVRELLENVVRVKDGHISLLESRLKVLGVEPGWQTLSGATLASIRTGLTTYSDVDIVRQALNDVRTGIVDARRLGHQLTDPVTSNLLLVIAKNLARFELRLATLYRAHKHLMFMEQS